MKDIKIKINYTPLLNTIKEQNLSENEIFKQWNIPRKTFYNIRHGRGITVDTLARLSIILNKEINQLVTFTYDIIDKPEQKRPTK